MFTGSEVKLVMSHLLQRLRSKSSVLLIIFQLSMLREKWHTVALQHKWRMSLFQKFWNSFKLGFPRKILPQCKSSKGNIQSIMNKYLRSLFPTKNFLLNRLSKLELLPFIFPSLLSILAVLSSDGTCSCSTYESLIRN